jgi:hypothetical protein
MDDEFALRRPAWRVGAAEPQFVELGAHPLELVGPFHGVAVSSETSNAEIWRLDDDCRDSTAIAFAAGGDCRRRWPPRRTSACRRSALSYGSLCQPQRADAA